MNAHAPPLSQCVLDSQETARSNFCTRLPDGEGELVIDRLAVFDHYFRTKNPEKEI